MEEDRETLIEALLSRPINLLVVHHTASPRSTTLEDVTRWHKARQFDTVGYHFFVGETGLLERGRDIERAGAHVRGHNSHSIGICLAGDNTDSAERWNDAQILTLADFVRSFRIFYPHAEIMGHRDVPGAKTECPGLDVMKLLREQMGGET